MPATTDKPKAAKKAAAKKKTCSRCKKEFPAAKFLKRADGTLKAYCPECRKAISRERYAAKHPKTEATPEQETIA
jgi:hypothetical protein